MNNSFSTPHHAQKDLLTNEIQYYHPKLLQMRLALENVYFGETTTVESLLVSLLAGGHILLVGAPGVAKTMVAKAFSELLGASFKRIQFTPDLLPSDITGVYIPNERNEFVLHKGPIFANIILGDEINRAPAKTQSAFLEAMQEGQVTIEGNTHPLHTPFMVVATQNPIDQRGVYELPEAQLDRFIIQVQLGYPNFEQELNILRKHQSTLPPLQPILTVEEINALIKICELVHISDELIHYIAKIVRATRENEQIALGASPRAGIALLRAAKARALLNSRDFVLPEDIVILSQRVLAHRLTLSIDAEYNHVLAKDVIQEITRRTSFA